MVKILESRLQFLENSIKALSDIKNHLLTNVGSAGRDYGSYQSDLSRIQDKMVADSRGTQEELDDLQSNVYELTDDVCKILIRRTERQAKERRLELGRDFWNDVKPEHKQIVDRDVPNKQWLVHYDLKVKSWDGWRYRMRPIQVSLLSGNEDGRDWTVRVPGTIKTIKGAIAWLTPAAVSNAEANGLQVHRQGDMYLVATKRLTNRLDALHSSRHTDHYLESMIVIDHPEHPPLHLPKFPQQGYGWVAHTQKQMGNGNSRRAAD
jgi:hypothetical protein